MKYKGLPIIVDALAKLKEHMDFRMVFVGGGPDADEMKQKVKELSITLCEGPDKVTPGTGKGMCIFTGPIYDREHLRAWNTRADLFLFPSTYDTNGIVVREAAACGLASVLIQDSCAAEGITHGRNGFVIEENAESMAELLMQVGKNVSHLREVGQHAMDEIYISWEESVHAAYERYGEVIENKKAGLYPRKRQIVEEQFKTYAVDLFDGTRKMMHMQRQLFDDMRDNVGTFIDDTAGEIKKDLLDGIREAFKD